MTQLLAQSGPDDLDLAVISALQEDGRVSYADLASRTGVTPDVARGRVLKLKELNAFRVMGVSTMERMEWGFFANIGLNISGPVGPVADQLIALPQIAFLVETAGGFDLIAEVNARDRADFLELLDSQVRSIPEITTTETFINLTFSKFEIHSRKPARSQRNIPISRPNWGVTTVATPPMVSPGRLTDEDNIIIDALTNDGRISYRDLAEMAGMSYATARRRAMALINSGVVEIVTVINREALGLGVFAHVGLRWAGNAAEAIQQLSEFPEVEMLSHCLGRFDAIAVIGCPDVDSQLDVVGRRIREVSPLLSLEVYPWLKMLKVGTDVRFG
ncbi:DNA-binding transcriptional regulator, Lrp family [Arthrobacter sp. cf158]|uniref:Lrp/AsnC family transcriptional regulator n=1 Tax=Arthrobacter sp. cf158 TaxID=1761744 RepID=UPI000894854C|nr:AsnC family transcriptional regulator [Arthrobacter sp. cf158]SDW92019.1 DNA-binding transcriptional regulator, Lrp family [Arthrobacter sp. cf158]